MNEARIAPGETFAELSETFAHALATRSNDDYSGIPLDAALDPVVQDLPDLYEDPLEALLDENDWLTSGLRNKIALVRLLRRRCLHAEAESERWRRRYTDLAEEAEDLRGELRRLAQRLCDALEAVAGSKG